MCKSFVVQFPGTNVAAPVSPTGVCLVQDNPRKGVRFAGLPPPSPPRHTTQRKRFCRWSSMPLPDVPDISDQPRERTMIISDDTQENCNNSLSTSSGISDAGSGCRARPSFHRAHSLPPPLPVRPREQSLQPRSSSESLPKIPKRRYSLTESDFELLFHSEESSGRGYIYDIAMGEED